MGMPSTSCYARAVRVERPAEIEDRAVPGHWEGDLLSGGQQLAHGYARRAPFSLRDADQGAGEGYRQRGFCTQQRGAPIAFATASIIDVGSGQGDGQSQEFHDRHRCAGVLLRSAQPVAARQQRKHQRLLRQYFPKGMDLSGYSQSYLNKIALRLNQRPRKTLGFATPADKLRAVLQ